MRVHLENQRGQTSIFVALIFQVLFILFAMAINIGLVVHDKINLQNSVDLTAYYMAQKQAEWLNAIAHTNYQIRQSFKLFAWRYKVLGTMGMDGEGGTPIHPALAANNFADTRWPYNEQPALCISHIRNWDVVGTKDNLCRVMQNSIPALPDVNVIAGFNPINTAVRALTQKIQGDLDQRCNNAAAFSWYFAMAAAQSFREDQRHRMMAINAFAENLAKDDMKDIHGDSVLVGARNTLTKNLTSENFDGLETFEVYNSMRGVTPREWLPRVLIFPYVGYIDFNSSSGCTGQGQQIEVLPQEANAKAYINGELQAKDLVFWSNQMNGFLRDGFEYTLGVEKNPWYVIYAGVKATTVTRPVFFPFGEGGVKLTAKAYAKPFGGRIGPWYSKTWPQSESTSVGDPIDKNLPFRKSATGTFLSSKDQGRLPDYSRYPGDHLGLKSVLSLNSLFGLKAVKSKIHYYSDVWKDITSQGAPSNDRLAWDFESDKAPAVRNYEIAAISPDLFDITYYSIEPNFYANYLQYILPARNEIGIPPNVILRADLGYRPGTSEGYAIQDQIRDANRAAPIQNSAGPLRSQQAFFYVRSKDNLLTAWMPGPHWGEENNFNQIFPEYFGECEVPDDQYEIKNPGSCIAKGGRTGYSVKIVSKTALDSEKWPIGGVGETGPLKNPPNDENWYSQ